MTHEVGDVRNHAAIVHGCRKSDYFYEEPFNPPQIFLELSGKFKSVNRKNHIYGEVRKTLYNLGLDKSNFGTKDWNPFGGFIKPGDKVFVKPNMVENFHPLGVRGVIASITHGSILRPLIDYIYIALKGDGVIYLGDSPIKETDFNEVLRIAGTKSIGEFYREELNFPIQFIDIRDLKVVRNKYGVMVGHENLRGDPKGYLLVNLKERSYFAEVDKYHKQLRSTASFYENEVSDAHRPGRHLYSISRTLMESDVIFTVPKMKVHRKAGVTLCMKNLVGSTNQKEWLPHHRYGSPETGGDLFPCNASPRHKFRETMYDFLIRNKLGRFTARFAYPLLSSHAMKLLPEQGESLEWHEGDWHGNDTVWRMCLDLNNVVLYADKNGNLTGKQQRKYFCFIDGVIGGEGEGPLKPTPKPAGMMVAGFNPLVVDLVATRHMGLDYLKIRQLQDGLRTDLSKLGGSVKPDSLNEILSGKLETGLKFLPPKGWQNHIELKP